MRHRKFYISLLLLFAAFAATAQTCPGPAVRTALINLQKSNIVNGTRWGQFGLTDTCGNQRYVTLDSLIVIVTDSIASDTALQYNWYVTNDTTTNLLRTAFILRSAWWRGIDSVGFLRWSMRPDNFDGSQFTLYQDSIVNDADTLIWKSSWQPALQFHDLQAEGTYFYADSLKVVGIGQFPSIPLLNFDGTEKGYFYDPSNNGIYIIDGNGVTGAQTYAYIDETYFSVYTQPDISGNNYSFSSWFGSSTLSKFSGSVNNDLSQYGVLELSMFSSDGSVNQNLFGVSQGSKDSVGASLYLGENTAVSSSFYQGNRAFGVRTFLDESPFDWLQINLYNDSIYNVVSFYNRAYYWKNEHPTGVAGDTLFHFWAATGPGGEAGKDPGFMTLDDICSSGVNWYNSDGTTTDNTRIATVTETATWLSNDVTADGVYPFRFELSGGSPNEPENMVWVFPAGDSATLSQSDQELIYFSSNQWLIKSNEATTVQADSFQYNPNLGGTGFRVGAYNVVTQNGITGTPTHRDAIAYNTITGTAQTEIFLDGSSAIWSVPTSSNTNFKIHVSAICSAAGNGVGITTGESWNSWHLGGIKRVTNTTSLVGTVQTPATAQSDAGMSTSVVTIDADDTDESLRIRFTPPSTAGSTTVIKVVATLELTQSSY